MPTTEGMSQEEDTPTREQLYESLGATVEKVVGPRHDAANTLLVMLIAIAILVTGASADMVPLSALALALLVLLLVRVTR